MNKPFVTIWFRTTGDQTSSCLFSITLTLDSLATIFMKLILMLFDSFIYNLICSSEQKALTKIYSISFVLFQAWKGTVDTVFRPNCVVLKLSIEMLRMTILVKIKDIRWYVSVIDYTVASKLGARVYSIPNYTLEPLHI